ncbi:MAG: hypothetical protein ACQXXG_09700 [Candidatus Bathyarchaeia archaeon]|jgi:hypothetical protein
MVAHLKKLIIISGSIRLLKEPTEPIPAIQRFDGVFIRLVRKYHKQLRDFDILILSPTYGLIKAEEKIGFTEPIRGSWRDLNLNENEISKLRESSLSTLQKLLKKKQYDEIYVNVGKSLLKTIEGFDKTVPQTIRITYAQGPGIGPKMAHMKNWIESWIKPS